VTQSEQVEYLRDMASLENTEVGEFWEALANMLEVCEYGSDKFIQAVRDEATENIFDIQKNYRNYQRRT
jgi:DNA-directed RNA polymerase subunit F